MTNIIPFPRLRARPADTVWVRGVGVSPEIAVELMADEIAANWGDETAMRVAILEMGFTTSQMERLGEAAWLKARAIRRAARGAA